MFLLTEPRLLAGRELASFVVELDVADPHRVRPGPEQHVEVTLRQYVLDDERQCRIRECRERGAPSATLEHWIARRIERAVSPPGSAARGLARPCDETTLNRPHELAPTGLLERRARVFVGGDAATLVSGFPERDEASTVAGGQARDNIDEVVEVAEDLRVDAAAELIGGNVGHLRHRTGGASLAAVNPQWTLRRAPTVAARTFLLAILVVGFAGCSASSSPPEATPTDFAGVSLLLQRGGLTIVDVVSGDAGCPNADLAKTAISFTASGLDQPSPTKVFLYRFNDRASFQRRSADVASCAASYAPDPSRFESADVSPYVVAGQGPWGERFRAAIRDALTVAAGNGG